MSVRAADDPAGCSLGYVRGATASPALRFLALYVILGASAVFILNGLDLHRWIAMWLQRDGFAGTYRSFARTPGGVSFSLAALFACYPAALVVLIWGLTGRLWRWPLLVSTFLIILAAISYMPVNSIESGPWMRNPLDLALFLKSISAGSPNFVFRGIHIVIGAGLFIWVLMSIPRRALAQVPDAARGIFGPADDETQTVLVKIALSGAIISSLAISIPMNLWGVVQAHGWRNLVNGLAMFPGYWATVLGLLAIPLGLLSLVAWVRRRVIRRRVVAIALLCAALPAINLWYVVLRSPSDQAIAVGGLVLAYLGPTVLLLLPVSRDALSRRPGSDVQPQHE